MKQKLALSGTSGSLTDLEVLSWLNLVLQSKHSNTKYEFYMSAIEENKNNIPQYTRRFLVSLNDHEQKKCSRSQSKIMSDNIQLSTVDPCTK